MKFNVTVSKGYYHVFTTEIKVEADTKDEAKTEANRLIDKEIITQWDFNDELTWEDQGAADSTLYQIEEIEEA